MKKILSVLIVIGILFSSCQKEITLDLTGTPPVLVVNGWATNQPIQKLLPQYNTGFIVKLTTTADYYSLDSFPKVSGATVTISDNAIPTNNTYILNETPALSGIYVGAPGTFGKSGLTYSLTIVSQGKTYTAQDYLDSIPKIDTALATVNTGKKGGYHLTYYTLNPAGDHYYLFKFYKNDTLLNDENGIFVGDGSKQFINPNISVLSQQSPYIYQLGDSTMLELFSISKTIYTFYDQLNSQIHTDGGFFSSIPANVPGNVSNGAVGIFQASMYYTNKTVIQ